MSDMLERIADLRLENDLEWILKSSEKYQQIYTDLCREISIVEQGKLDKDEWKN